MSKETCNHWRCNKSSLEGEKFCLFHKPDKNEDEAKEFYKGLIYDKTREEYKAKREKLYLDIGKLTRYRWTEQCLWKGFVFPEPPDGFESFFRYSVFEEGVFCSNATFEQTVHFNKSTFNSNAEFFNVNFMGGGMFNDVHFKGNVRFGGAIFDSTAAFNSAHFYNRAYFNNTQFGGNKIVNFGSTIFDGSTTFAGASFKNVVRFKKAVFNGDLSFSNSHFNHGVEGLSKIGDNPRVSDLTEVFVQNSLTSDELLSIAKIGDHTYQKEIELYGKEGGNLLTNPDEKGKQEFKAEYATKTEMREVLKYIEANIDLSHVHGVKVREFKVMPKFSSPEAQEVACRIQRISYEEDGEKEKADQMFLYEMRAQRANKDSQFQQFIDWLVADWTCRYGTSWQRVLGISSASILFFAFMYWGKKISGLVATEGFGSVIASHTAEYFGKALHRSIIVFTTLGYTPHYFQDSPIMQTLSAVESIIGALAVALIIIVFARKWMRS